MNATAIPIPPRLARRPLWRGLPIPYIATIGADGEPDFRLTDHDRRTHVIRHRWCQLCGQGLGNFVFFTGGPAAAQALAYFEPACHLDCLIYAMQVCPFIAGQMKHADIGKVQADHPDMVVQADASYSTVKSPYWVIIKAKGYVPFLTADQTILLRPKPVLARTGNLHAETMKAGDWLVVREWLFTAPQK